MEASGWLLCALAPLGGADGEEPTDATHEVRAVALAGEVAALEHVADFEGTLHVWAESADLDPRLRIVDEAGELLAEDDDEGGGTTAFVALPVEPGRALRISVAAADPDAAGDAAVHLVAAPETEETMQAERRAREALREMERLRQEGDLEAARTLGEEILDELEPVPGRERSAKLNYVVWYLGISAYSTGAIRTARRAWAQVLEHRELCLPPDHPELLEARQSVAIMMSRLGELGEACALLEDVLAALERILPDDHLDVLAARLNLAGIVQALGDLRRARELDQGVVEAYQRLLPDDDYRLLLARQNLATIMIQTGELAEALEITRDVLEIRERTLPAEHLELLQARNNLAGIMLKSGDLAGARALWEAVIAAQQRTLPADHPDLLATRRNLAVAMKEMGDLAGARAIQEAVLATLERTLPADHPELLLARNNLASTLESMGDADAADALVAQVLEASERALPADHPDRLRAEQNFAVSLRAAQKLAAARELLEHVVEAGERVLGPDHPDQLDARLELALTLHRQGDLCGARAIEEDVVAAYERILPEDHPRRIRAELGLARSAVEMDDLEGARAAGERLADAMMRRLQLIPTLAPREARAAVATEEGRLSMIILLSPTDETGRLKETVFELIETMRHVSADVQVAGIESDDEISRLRNEIGSLRTRLNDLVAGGTSSGVASASFTEELVRLARERDRLERELRSALGERLDFVWPIRLADVARALPERSAAVTYRRLKLPRVDEESGHVDQGGERLVVQVVHRDGGLDQFDLGQAPWLEDLADDWRRAVGSASSARGVPIVEERAPAEQDALAIGEDLRDRMLGRVLEAVGDVDRLYVCLDDFQHLVPLEALPLDGGVVGDRVRVHTQVSLARLVEPRPASGAPPTLLAMGGVDYAAAVEPTVAANPAIPSAPVEGVLRKGSPATGFDALAETGAEVERIGELFAGTHEGEPELLRGERATKASFRAIAPGASHLHLATHGWFAPESIPSLLDARTGGRPGEQPWTPRGARETVTGLAPMTLCGLAFAGANRGRDSVGRVAGIMTAEELAGIDLSACELAVLSACETSVGSRRAGQGIQSLQSALHAAGARTAVTSLWRVDDVATRRLMERFYSFLWEKGLPKAEALWKAKCALREEGAPLRDWAGWVMTGDPD